MPGAPMGTAAYMSPEQARGEELDARTDLYSFGLVLYEMATGRAFEGKSLGTTSEAIPNRASIPALRLNPDSPPELERIINKALEKDREVRYQSASDMRANLIRLKRDSDSGRSAAVAAGIPRHDESGGVKPPLRRWAAIALAGVVLIAVIAGAAWFNFFRPVPKVAGPPLRAVPFTAFPGCQEFARFSPDGNQIAFSWNGEKEDNYDIYVKQIGTEKLLRLTTDPGEDTTPAWSPDGRYIAFRRRGEREDGIYIVPALGGPERKLKAVSPTNHWGPRSLDWTPDGKYLAYVDRQPGQQGLSIFLMAVENPDDNRALTSPPSRSVYDVGPRFSPDGKTLAFIRGGNPSGENIYTIPVAGGKPRHLTLDELRVLGMDWTPDGAYIVFNSLRRGEENPQQRLWKVPATGGKPEVLPVGQPSPYAPSLSRDGRRLAYDQWYGYTNILRYELSTGSSRRTSPTRLIASTRRDYEPQFSPDGRRIVFGSDRAGALEIWVCDSDGSNPRRLTFSGDTYMPKWSPDSRQIAFNRELEGIPRTIHALRPDNKAPGGVPTAIYVVSAEGGLPRRLTTGSSTDGIASWSRDGKWIYFDSYRTTAWQVWKMPAEGGQPLQVTKQGGSGAVESRDGKTLYYLNAKGDEGPGLWKVPVEGGEETPVLEHLGAVDWGQWCLTAEGFYFYNRSARTIEFLSFATHKVTQIVKPEKWGPSVYTPGLAVSPDGRSILWSQMADTCNIVLVENFHW